MQETWVQSLVWEDTLEKEMATHSSILAWRIAWTEEPGGLQSIGCKESDTTEWLTQHNIPLCICITSSLSIYLLMDDIGLSSISWLLKIMLRWTMHVSFQISGFVFSDMYPGVDFLGCMVALVLVFRSLHTTSFIVASQIYIPTNSVQGSRFLPSFPVFVTCRRSHDSHSERWEVIAHCCFDLHLSHN